MSDQGVDHFAREINRLVEYTRREYDLTYAEAIGTLALKQHELARESMDGHAEEQEEDE